MDEWINPEYAELVAAFRQQDEDTDAPTLGLSLDAAPGPAVRGFIVKPSDV
ncbi:hypothetical protein [Kitasatospora kifunensis]|uniref:Uncharacterized protein n=1 Tax=Kitasatospora kifunensis TaxID=58351 RepID=A0A7W7R769_KITKI|nr:hypothetical protein [Kitasatospora kifunensis]MBB4926363.1 hypothetical protein [Kitasatospora kifunensis]